MKIHERRVPRVSRMVSEWFREVPDDPGMVRNGPGSVRNGFGHIWKVRKDRKVMEGSGGVGVIRTNERSPDGSIIGASMLP